MFTTIEDRQKLKELEMDLFWDASEPVDVQHDAKFMHRFQYAMLQLTKGIGNISRSYVEQFLLEIQPAPVVNTKERLIPPLCDFLCLLVSFNNYLHCDVDIYETLCEAEQANIAVGGDGSVCIPSNIFAVSRAIGTITATSELGFDRNLGTLYHDVVYEFGLMLSALASVYSITLSQVLENYKYNEGGTIA